MNRWRWWTWVAILLWIGTASNLMSHRVETVKDAMGALGAMLPAMAFSV